MTDDRFAGVYMEAAPWDDGSSPPGNVNILVPEWELVLMQDIETELAHEIVRRWNAATKPLMEE